MDIRARNCETHVLASSPENVTTISFPDLLRVAPRRSPPVSPPGIAARDRRSAVALLPCKWGSTHCSESPQHRPLGPLAPPESDAPPGPLDPPLCNRTASDDERPKICQSPAVPASGNLRTSPSTMMLAVVSVSACK